MNPSRLQECPTKVETTAAEHDEKEIGEHLQLICTLHFPSTPLIADNAQVHPESFCHCCHHAMQL